jgi:hypothetical protein
MKEVRFWEAEDGERFDNEYDCEQHELEIRFAELLAVVPCYNDAFMRMTGEDEGFDESDIRYILIPDKITASFDDALRELDEVFFERQLPYWEAKSHNDLLYWDEDSQSWRVWSKDLANLEILKNHFQLFGEGE